MTASIGAAALYPVRTSSLRMSEERFGGSGSRRRSCGACSLRRRYPAVGVVEAVRLAVQEDRAVAVTATAVRRGRECYREVGTTTGSRHAGVLGCGSQRAAGE